MQWFPYSSFTFASDTVCFPLRGLLPFLDVNCGLKGYVIKLGTTLFEEHKYVNLHSGLCFNKTNTSSVKSQLLANMYYYPTLIEHSIETSYVVLHINFDDKWNFTLYIYIHIDFLQVLFQRLLCPLLKWNHHLHSPLSVRVSTYVYVSTPYCQTYTHTANFNMQDVHTFVRNFSAGELPTLTLSLDVICKNCSCYMLHTGHML